jgi:hypothetical protein
MSRLRSDKLVNKNATGAPELTYGATVPSTGTISGAGSINLTGIVTATTFSGNLTGNATGLTGTPNITVGSVTGSSATFSGNVSVGGTLTYEDVTNIDSVGLVTARTGVRVTAGGLVVTSGVTTIGTLEGNSGLVSVGSTIRTRGFVETQSSASVASNVLSLDASNGTVFTHTTSAQIGIVSFSGIRTDTAGTQTFSVLVTQGASPTNTTGATGIGTQLATVVTTGGVGYSTHIKVGAGSSIILTGTAGALDLLTFIVSYDGNAPSNSAFRVVGFAATDFRNAIV